MALLQIIIAGKTYLVFGAGNLTFIRDQSSTKEINITYSSGTGQTLAAGQQLYAAGTPGTEGYLQVVSKNSAVLSGSGIVVLNVTHYPGSAEANKPVSFIYDNSNITLNLTYNSNPVTTDIIVQTDNRITKTFSSNDFTTAYSDYDNDAVSQVAVFGTVVGFNYNGSAYIAGTYFDVSNAGLLTYTPLDQDPAYGVNANWKAKDSQGNISVN